MTVWRTERVHAGCLWSREQARTYARACATGVFHAPQPHTPRAEGPVCELQIKSASAKKWTSEEEELASYLGLKIDMIEKEWGGNSTDETKKEWNLSKVLPSPVLRHEKFETERYEWCSEMLVIGRGSGEKNEEDKNATTSIDLIILGAGAKLIFDSLERGNL